MARTRRMFTKEYRAEVVRMVADSGKSPGKVAQDLGLTPSSVTAWVAQAKADAGKGRPGALTSDERQELALLRREVKQLKMERDFLKNTLARSRTICCA